tara:strand:+ start:291 stop:449 length:159 start_codon:yes stop_codon:yes gene_type:complete
VLELEDQVVAELVLQEPVQLQGVRTLVVVEEDLELGQLVVEMVVLVLLLQKN